MIVRHSSKYAASKASAEGEKPRMVYGMTKLGQRFTSWGEVGGARNARRMMMNENMSRIVFLVVLVVCFLIVLLF